MGLSSGDLCLPQHWVNPGSSATQDQRPKRRVTPGKVHALAPPDDSPYMAFNSGAPGSKPVGTTGQV
jgi:hypothetical protein